MKLTAIALTIVLSSSPSRTWAFAPTSLGPPSPLHYYSFATTTCSSPFPSISTTTSTTMSMVGGGMIERPPSDDDNDDDDDDATSRIKSSSPSYLDRLSSSRSNLSAYRDEMERQREERIKKLYENGNVDPYDPDSVPIPPRPGKYGWSSPLAKFMEKEEEVPDIPDDQLKQTMSGSERDENLKVMRRLANDEIPVLFQVRDMQAYTEAKKDFERRKRADPWYGVNDRLADAFRLGEFEKVDYLKELAEKLGGPPPILEKAKSSTAFATRGYIPVSDIYARPLSNEVLRNIIRRREDMAAREKKRKDDAEAAKNYDREARKEKHEQELRKMAEENFNSFLNRGVQDNNRFAERMAEIEKRRAKEEEERQELIKQLGGEIPDLEAENKRYLMSMRKEFTENYRRKLSGFEGEDDEFEGMDDDDDDILGNRLSSLSSPGGEEDPTKPLSKAAQARAEALKNDGSGRPRLPGDRDVTIGELDPNLSVNESSTATTGPLTVEVSSTYNSENSDPPMRKHCFQYTVRITNNSPKDTVQLLSRRFEIQTVGSAMKDVVQGEGVTGRQPVLKPGEVFEYTSTAPLSVRPIGTTIIAARMSGEYRYCVLNEGQEQATEEQINKGQGDAGAELATFHFVFPEEQRVKPIRPDDDEDEEEDDEVGKTTVVASSSTKTSSPPPNATDATSTPSTSSAATSSSPASTLPGEPDMTSGSISITPNDSSDTLTSDVRVVVTSTYRPERSDSKLDKHCFAYNVRITNESKSDQSIQLVSRRFEIQTIGSANKDVVQGPGVTGRQPVLKPGESFEYTSTAPLSVRPMLDKTKVVARMSGEYNFVQLGKDGVTPISSTPLKAELGAFHFILPE